MFISNLGAAQSKLTDMNYLHNVRSAKDCLLYQDGPKSQIV